MNEMPYDEFLNWLEYFEARPVGWRDDLRIFRIMQSIGIKERPEAVFESLAKKRDYETKLEKATNKTVTTLGASVLFSKLITAKGGDTPEFLKQL